MEDQGAAVDTTPWWRDAVVYQIYPRSFCDTTGNGIGDLEGVCSHLDHLAWLGVDAIWLSPFYPSPMADFGYDVADYCDVDPTFGTLADLDRLVAEAHARDLRVLVDWVPNHTSDRHPWFAESRSSRDNPKRDWYLWAEGMPDRLPTDWQAAFPPGPAWTWDPGSDAWYLHLYTPQQPDLNWSNPEVEAAMHATLRFWLDRGVDGFRMDVIHRIGKDPARITSGADDPTDAAFTHELVRRLRLLLDEYDEERPRVGVGEVYVLDTPTVASFYGHDDELHLNFNFRPQWARWDAPTWRHEIEEIASELEARGAWPVWVLSNHDIPRTASRLGDPAATRAAAVLLLTLRGTPFLYAGEELGLEDAEVPPDRVLDPAGFRDGCRAPLPWDASDTHGWKRPGNWLPWPPDAATRNAESERADPDSTLRLYRRLLARRRESVALRRGEQRLLDTPAGVLGYERRAARDRRIVLVNFTDAPRAVPGDEAYVVELATGSAADGAPFAGTLGPNEAVVLRPA